MGLLLSVRTVTQKLKSTGNIILASTTLQTPCSLREACSRRMRNLDPSVVHSQRM